MNTAKLTMAAEIVNTTFVAADAFVDLAVLTGGDFFEPLVVGNKLAAHCSHINTPLADLIIDKIW